MGEGVGEVERNGTERQEKGSETTRAERGNELEEKQGGQGNDEGKERGIDSQKSS